jgi:hypothetical protein
VTLVAKVDAAHGDRHARTDVVSECDGAEEALAADAIFLAGRESRENDRRAGM